MNLKKLTVENIKNGINSVTPLQLSRSSLYTYYGIMVGAAISFATFMFAKQWGVSIIMLFVFLSQIIAIVSEMQKIKILEDNESQINMALKEFEKNKKEMI